MRNYGLDLDFLETMESARKRKQRQNHHVYIRIEKETLWKKIKKFFKFS